MTDLPVGGFADTPGSDATPEQDADIRALLAGLRDDDIPMPDDVVARISAAIATEHGSGRAAAGGLTALGEGEPGPAHATVSVLPVHEARSGRPSYAGLKWLAAAAALVVVAGGALGIVRLTSGGSSSMSSGGAMSSTSGGSDSAKYSASGTAYTSAALAAQAGALAASPRGAFTANDGSAPAVPAAGGEAATARAVPPADLTGCVRQLAGRDGVTPVAVDTGTFDGAPATIVVLPTDGDPASLDVWVVAPGCAAAGADVLQWQRIARP